jgi:CRP-like cAMP-binding protein
MFETLLAVLAGNGTLTEEQVALVQSVFVPRAFERGQFVQRAGEVTRRGGFVARGCFRMYVINENGTESIVQFAPEGSWIGDLQSATTEDPSPYFIDAIEPSTALFSDLPSFEKVLEAIPEAARGFRMGMQRSRDVSQRRIALSLHGSAEERYLDYVERYPSLAQRIPQHMLASYLGMTPETLSRVRARLKGR